MEFNFENFMAFTGASTPAGDAQQPSNDDDDEEELEFSSAAMQRPSFFDAISANIEKATESDEVKFARWKKEEDERRLTAKTPEEQRNIGVVRHIMDTLAEAREAREPSLLDSIATHFADDAMYVNGHLAGTVYTFAEPSVGGVGFVQHLKDFWFGRWEVEVRAESLCCDVNACGPVVTFQARVHEWKVRRTGRSVRNADDDDDDDKKAVMVESHAVHFTGGPDAKIQQWLYYCDYAKTANFIHAFGKKPA